MYHLMYVSYATQKFSDNDLSDLLIKARKNNSDLGITGMLIHRDGNFIQVLEGEEQAVKHLYAVIAADQRHAGAIIMTDGAMQQRQFSNWAMDYRNYSKNALFTEAEMANDYYGILSVLSDFVQNMH